MSSGGCHHHLGGESCSVLAYAGFTIGGIHCHLPTLGMVIQVDWEVIGSLTSRSTKQNFGYPVVSKYSNSRTAYLPTLEQSHVWRSMSSGKYQQIEIVSPYFIRQVCHLGTTTLLESTSRLSFGTVYRVWRRIQWTQEYGTMANNSRTTITWCSHPSTRGRVDTQYPKIHWTPWSSNDSLQIYHGCSTRFDNYR